MVTQLPRQTVKTLLRGVEIKVKRVIPRTKSSSPLLLNFFFQSPTAHAVDISYIWKSELGSEHLH